MGDAPRDQVAGGPATLEVEALVAGARLADAVAWEALYRRAHPGLHRYARRRLATDDQADDAVSEAMTRAMAGIATFRWNGSAGGFDGWLFGILRRVVLEAYRAGARGPIVSGTLPEAETGAEHDPVVGLVAREEAQMVRSAFARLSAADRELLQQRVVGRQRADAVGAATGRRAGAVRMAQTRALTRLRTLLQDEASRSRAPASW